MTPQESVLLMLLHPSREIEITILCKDHFCSYDLPLQILGDLTVEHDGLFSPDVSRGDSNTEGEGSRLGDEMHLWIVEGQPGRMHGERDPARLPGCEGEAGKTEQHAVGTGDRGDFITTVELHHLVTCALSGVMHLDGDLDWLSRTRCLHDKVPVAKRGVAQPMSKSEQRRGRRVGIIAIEHWVITASTKPNMI